MLDVIVSLKPLEEIRATALMPCVQNLAHHCRELDPGFATVLWQICYEGKSVSPMQDDRRRLHPTDENKHPKCSK